MQEVLRKGTCGCLALCCEACKTYRNRQVGLLAHWINVMPGGKYDSWKARVRPVFDALWKGGRNWLPQLLALPSGGCADAAVATGDLSLLDGHWEPNEICLKPPVSLLSWLIRNVRPRPATPLDNDLRQRLADGDPGTIAE